MLGMSDSKVRRTGAGAQRCVAGRRGFTVLEITFSILIIGLILGLLIRGVRGSLLTAEATVDATAVNALSIAVDQYRREVGSPLPLVRDFPNGGTPVNGPIDVTNPARSRIRVVSEGVPADAARLRRQLTGASAAEPFGVFDRSDFAGNSGNAPTYDVRFSEYSLSYFLAGACEAGYASQPAALAQVPIDGIPGPGMFQPQEGGVFRVPPAALADQQQDRLRQGLIFESFAQLSGSIRLSLEADPARRWDSSLTDRRGVRLRYYRWLQGTVPAGGGDPVPARNLDELNVPLLVGRSVLSPAAPASTFSSAEVPQDRDLERNPALRAATWAIVAAGPNGVFGDEPIEQLASALNSGVPGDAGEERKLRLRAERDNIVRVGTDAR